MSKPPTPGTRTPAGSKTPSGGTGTRTPANAESGGNVVPSSSAADINPVIQQAADATAAANISALPPPSAAPPEVAALIHPPGDGAAPPAATAPPAAADPAAPQHVLPDNQLGIPGLPPGPISIAAAATDAGAGGEKKPEGAGENDDDDDDDGSDGSSDGYDFGNGELVISENMSERRRRAALERAMQKKEAEDIHVELNVTALPPRRSAAQIRANSLKILDEAREVIAVDLGVPPVKVVSEGYVMPRESVVTTGKPIVLADDEGNVTLVAPPSTGFGLDKKFDDIEKERTKDKSTVQHYRRSLDALKEVRQARLMRQLEFE